MTCGFIRNDIPHKSRFPDNPAIDVEPPEDDEEPEPDRNQIRTVNLTIDHSEKVTQFLTENALTEPVIRTFQVG